jgi:hypothetical protein
MNSIALWINEAIVTWRREGIALQAGVSLQYIEEVEQMLGFTFPDDFKEFYTTVDGFANDTMSNSMIYMWSMNKIFQEHIAGDDDEFIGFCDYMINSHRIGFIKNERGIYKCYDQVIPIAETFSTCIQLIYTDSDLII